MLFRVALACMKLKSKEICECSDIISVYVLLKSNNHKNTYDLTEERVATLEDIYRSSSNATLDSSSSGGSTGAGAGAAGNPQRNNSGKTRSKASQLLYFAFGKKWLISMPRQPIDNLRVKIRVVRKFCYLII